MAWKVMPAEPVTDAAVPPTNQSADPRFVDDLRRGLDLGDHEDAERRLLALLASFPKMSQHTIIDEIFERLMRADPDGDDNDIHVYGSLLEAGSRIDPTLIERDHLACLTISSDHQHRMCAASILWDLANVAPGLVPLDLVITLAKPATEDWYVFSPAIAAAKQLMLTRRSAIGVFEALSDSDDAEDRRAAAAALRDVAEVNLAVVPEEFAMKLAGDMDRDVADVGKSVVQLVAHVTDEERRKAFGSFGL
jgi:hypothetical protein